MVQSPGEGRPFRVRSLVQDMDTAKLAAVFLRSRLRLAPATIRNNRWALMRLADAHPTLPLDQLILIDFVRAEARYLTVASQQTLWDILRVFYAWATEQGKPVPALQHVFFGRRRRGAKRKRKRRIRV